MVRRKRERERETERGRKKEGVCAHVCAKKGYQTEKDKISNKCVFSHAIYAPFSLYNPGQQNCLNYISLTRNEYVRIADTCHKIQMSSTCHFITQGKKIMNISTTEVIIIAR